MVTIVRSSRGAGGRSFEEKGARASGLRVGWRLAGLLLGNLLLGSLLLGGSALGCSAEAQGAPEPEALGRGEAAATAQANAPAPRESLAAMLGLSTWTAIPNTADNAWAHTFVDFQVDTPSRLVVSLKRPFVSDRAYGQTTVDVYPGETYRSLWIPLYRDAHRPEGFDYAIEATLTARDGSSVASSAVAIAVLGTDEYRDQLQDRIVYVEAPRRIRAGERPTVTVWYESTKGHAQVDVGLALKKPSAGWAWYGERWLRGRGGQVDQSVKYESFAVQRSPSAGVGYVWEAQVRVAGGAEVLAYELIPVEVVP